MPGDDGCGEDLKSSVVKVEGSSPYRKRARTGTSIDPSAKRRRKEPRGYGEQELKELRLTAQALEGRFKDVKCEKSEQDVVDDDDKPSHRIVVVEAGRSGLPESLETAINPAGITSPKKDEAQAERKNQVSFMKTTQRNSRRRGKRNGDKEDFGDASEADVAWAKSLSGPHLDLIVSVKQLAMERLRSTKESSLNGILTPTALRTIGVILEEFVKDRVQTLSRVRNTRPLPASSEKHGLDDLSICKDTMGDGLVGTDHMETAPDALDTGEREQKNSSSDVDLPPQSPCEGDDGGQIHEDGNGYVAGETIQDLRGLHGSAEAGGENDDPSNAVLEVPPFTEQKLQREKELRREARKEWKKKGKEKLEMTM